LTQILPRQSCLFRPTVYCDPNVAVRRNLPLNIVLIKLVIPPLLLEESYVLTLHLLTN
jgi:hypothetical protein